MLHNDTTSFDGPLLCVLVELILEGSDMKVTTPQMGNLAIIQKNRPETMIAYHAKYFTNLLSERPSEGSCCDLSQA
jgi:hypothetical protein